MFVVYAGKPLLPVRLGDAGIEHPQLEQSKTTILTSGGAKSGAHNAPKPLKDADLQLIIDVWPNLPDAIKAAIKALIQTHKTETR